MVLMGVLLLEFLSRMAFYSADGSTSRLAAAGQTAAAALGIWLGKSWKDRGFRLMACYIGWMALRCFVTARAPADRAWVLDRILTLVWLAGGCYSLGRILTIKEIRHFAGTVCLLWTAGMAVSAGLGITAAWMRIRIPNFGGGAWRIWGEAGSARLNLVYCSTVSGGMLSFSVLLALVTALQVREQWKKAFCLTAVLPMTLALCLTDSRTALLSLTAGIAALTFACGYLNLHSTGCLRSGYIARRAPVGPLKLLLLSAGALAAGALVLLVLLNVNPLFDEVKITLAKAGILPSGAVTEETTIRMAHRGFGSEGALTGRDRIWRAALSFFGDHPRYLLYGASAVNPMARILDQSALDFEAAHCHNILLQVLAEGGLPALLLLGGFLFCIAGKALRTFRSGNKLLWTALLPCVLLSMLFGDMGECLLWTGFRDTPLPSAFFLLAGLLSASDPEAGAENRRPRLRRTLVLPAVCAAVLLVSLSLVLHHEVPVIRQDDYDNPVDDLYYLCGDENCETHHGNHTIKTSGCGLCAISNAVRYMTGGDLDVRGLAAFARENEQYIVHVGSKSTVSEAAAGALGEEYGFCFIGQVPGLQEATGYIRQGCTVIAGVGNSRGGGHLLVIADYDPLTKEYLVLDSAGNYDGWSHAFCSWQRITDGRLTTNPDVFLTSFRILGPSRLKNLALPPV